MKSAEGGGAAGQGRALDVADGRGSGDKRGVPNEPHAPKDIFSAYQQEPPARRFPLWAIAAALAVAGAALALASGQEPYRLVTARGIKAIFPGISQAQFVDIVGDPIAPEPGADDCYRYGTLTLEKPSFVLYTACFEDGKLREVIPKTYGAAAVQP